MSNSSSAEGSETSLPNLSIFIGCRNANIHQKKILHDLLEADKIKDLREKRTKEQWVSTVEKLNSIGPAKTAAQWRRTWHALINYRNKKRKRAMEKPYVQMPVEIVIFDDAGNNDHGDNDPNDNDPINNDCIDNDLINNDSIDKDPIDNDPVDLLQRLKSTLTTLESIHTTKDVSMSDLYDSQDRQDPIEVDDSDDEDDEVSRRIKEGEEFCGRVMRVVSRIMHEGRVVEDVASMRLITMNKLRFLLTVNDSTDKLGPEAQMSITDWLLFDTVLVHQRFDVIHMDLTTKSDRKILVLLYTLVVAHDIESLVGDQLAEAWAALTLAYNNDNRQVTPMLLQRRWYQLKLTTRERFRKLSTLLQGTEELSDFIIKYKLTPLQEAIVTRYKSLVVAPFIPWKELIKTERVILREQFESIAMNKKVKCTETPKKLINPHMHLDSNFTALNLPSSEIGTPLHNFDNNTTFEANDQASHTLKNESSGQVDNSLFGIEEVKSEEFIEVSPAHNEIDSSNNDEPPIIGRETGSNLLLLLPLNVNLSVAPSPMLPTITNIFGNVNVPIEALPKISVMAAQKQLKNDTTVLNNLPYNNNAVNNTNINRDVRLNEDSTNLYCNEKFGEIEKSSPNYTEDFNVKNVSSKGNRVISNFPNITIRDDDDDNNLVNDVTEVSNDEFTHQTGKMAADKEHKNNKIEDSQKMIMNPLVVTVKLDDMGIPIKYLEHVYSKDLIEIIHLKSKPKIKLIDTTGKCRNKNKTLDTKKVKLSNSIFKKPNNRKYNYKKLCKNPDFIPNLKKLNSDFLASSHNQLLLKSCKPVTVDVSEEFLNKLVGGKMYIDVKDNTDIPNKTVNRENDSASPPATNIQSLTNSECNVKPVINATTPETLKYITVPYKSDIRLVSQRLLKREKTSPLKTLIVKNKNDFIPNFAAQETVEVESAIDDAIQNTNSNKNIEKLPASNTKFESPNALPTVLNDNLDWRKKYCCWSQGRLNELKLGSTLNGQHSCPEFRCKCCCKRLLEEYCSENSYYSHKPMRKSNKKRKEISDLSSQEPVTSKELHIDLPETLQQFETPDQQIPLQDNNILLTTAQIPSNLKRFQAFCHYLTSTVKYPKGIHLLPSGQAVWNPIDMKSITAQYSTTITNLINEFNQLYGFTKETDNTGLSDEVKSSLGKIFNKTLRKVTFVSELQYAYSNNGLFFRYNLDTGSLDLTNISINVSKAPVETEFILPD